MSFYDKVNGLCRQKGISITALAIELGFSKGAPTGWKTMVKPPRAANVKKIADYFGVGVDYFSEESQPINITSGSNSPVTITSGHHNTVTLTNGGVHTRELSEIEAELLRVCEKLETRKKALLLARAYELLDE